MAQTVEVPDGSRVVLVSEQLIERVRAEAREDGWSLPVTVQVHVPDADGLVVDPQFRTVST